MYDAAAAAVRAGMHTLVETVHLGALATRRAIGSFAERTGEIARSMTAADRRLFRDAEVDTGVLQRLEAIPPAADPRRLLESTLYVEDRFRVPALLGGERNPELLFGDAEWAGQQEASRVAERYGDRPLTVDFMQSIRREFGQGTMDDPAALHPGAGSPHWGVLSRDLTDAERAALEGNPYLSYAPPFDGREFGVIAEPVDAGGQGLSRVRVLTEPVTAADTENPLSFYGAPTSPRALKPHGVILYSRWSGPEAVQGELQRIADWYNEVKADPAHDPFELAAGLQQRVISLHPFQDFSGRTSRTLMNWSLRNDGQWPSAIRDFDRDIYSSPSEWTRAVREGSARYGGWARKITAPDAATDPLEVFDLRRLQPRFDAYPNKPAPVPHGEQLDTDAYDKLLDHLSAA
jgi:hypothetical protein